MKRIEFIRNIGLAGAGVALVPAKLVFGKSNTKSQLLPAATVHVPHANFDSATTQSVHIPELNIECAVERYMRNGIQESSNDLQVITLTRGNEAIIASFGESETQVTGEIEGLSLLKASSMFSIQSSGWAVEFRRASNSFLVSRIG